MKYYNNAGNPNRFQKRLPIKHADLIIRVVQEWRYNCIMLLVDRAVQTVQTGAVPSSHGGGILSCQRSLQSSTGARKNALGSDVRSGSQVILQRRRLTSTMGQTLERNAHALQR